MLPDMEGFEVARRLGAQRSARADHLPDRARRDRGQGARPHDGRRRLRDQALQPRGARGADPHDPAARRPDASPTRGASPSRTSSWTRRRARSRAPATPIELSATEYRLLHYMMLNPRRVLTRSQILDHVWDYDFGGDARVLETYVSYLRRKLNPHGPQLIHTVRGVGYALRAARDLTMSLRARLVLGMLALTALGPPRGGRRHLRGAEVVPAGPRRPAGARGAAERLARARRAGRQRSRLRASGTGSAVRRRPGDRATAAGPRGGGGPERRGQPAAGHLRPAPGRERRGARQRGLLLRTSSRSPAPEIPADLEPGEVHHGEIERGPRVPRAWPQQTGGQPGTTIVGGAAGARSNRTLDRLLRVEALVIGGVLLALALLSWLIVRLGLRPLDRIGDTAGAIAAGDLSRRVSPATPARRWDGSASRSTRCSSGSSRLSAEREASENRLRRFLADASHELRTPLASIRGYAELFRIGAARESGGRREGDAPDRERVGPDGSRRRGPADARAARRGPRRRARARSTSPSSRAMRPTTRARWTRRASGCGACRRWRRRQRRSASAAAGASAT